jgi:hypothetical protein
MALAAIIEDDIARILDLRVSLAGEVSGVCRIAEVVGENRRASDCRADQQQ